MEAQSRKVWESQKIAQGSSRGVISQEKDWGKMQKDLLTCVLQSCGACKCPAMRWKKEPVDSDRGISVFLDGHLNRSEAKVLEQLPTEYRGGQAGHGSSLHWRGAALSCREHDVTSTPWSTGGLPHSSQLAAVMKADVS